MAEATSRMILAAFEAELDSLIELIESERNPSTVDAIFKRFSSAQELYADLAESMSRVDLKVRMAGARLVEGTTFPK